MKIQLVLSIESDAYSEQTMELIRVNLRKSMLRFVFENIDETPLGLGKAHISHVDFKVDGNVRLIA